MPTIVQSCFTPVAESFIATIKCLGEKFGHWWRNAIGWRPTNDGGHNGGHNGGFNDIDKDSENHEFRRKRSSNANRTPMIGGTRVSQADYKIYNGMENMVHHMLNQRTGVPFILGVEGSIPFVFTGIDLVWWLMDYIPTCQETEAVYLGNVLASLGFLYPLHDRTLKVKNDTTFYRFQSPAYWKSGETRKDDESYAAYLIKRQVYGHHEIYESLTDYEKIALEKLEIKLSTNWDSIKETAVRDMNEMNAWSIEEIIVLFSEQRAFWDVHRPLGCVPNKPEFEFDYTRLLMFMPYF